MKAADNRTVSADESGMRVDRWFHLHYPQLTHSYLNKLLRTGQVRVAGRRVKGKVRLQEGQMVRIPPLAFANRSVDRPSDLMAPLSKQEGTFFRSMVLHEDDDLFVLNKPEGLAVQGGTRTLLHVDGLLMGLAVELGERPRLVHRLDRDTSGVLVIAKRRAVASSLGRLFATRNVRKIYWALVKGVPKPRQGRIDLPLIKAQTGEGDRVRAAGEEENHAQRAVTNYAVIDKAPPEAVMAFAQAGHRPATPVARPHVDHPSSNHGRCEIWRPGRTSGRHREKASSACPAHYISTSARRDPGCNRAPAGVHASEPRVLWIRSFTLSGRRRG